MNVAACLGVGVLNLASAAYQFWGWHAGAELPAVAVANALAGVLCIAAGVALAVLRLLCRS